MSSTTQTCAEAIVESLIRGGVDTIFGIPGAQTYALFDALYKNRERIRTFVTRHEQGAAYMAFGYAKSTGKVGVYCVVPGPGVLNSTAGLCTAHNTPVLCIAGQVPSAFVGVGHGMLHELPAFRWQEGIATIQLIRIDIDPTQSVRLRGDLSIVADSRLALQALLMELREDPGDRSSLEAEFEAVNAEAWREIQQIQPQMSYLDVMREVLPRDAFVVEEISQVGFTAWYGFPVYEPGKLVTGGYQGNLGHGFQTGIGVKIANPDSTVVSIAGDGGFMYGVQELATAVLYKVGLITLIFNNNAFGNVRRDQIEFYEGRVFGYELINPDFVTLAESFGARAHRVNSPAELGDRLQGALEESKRGPVVLEIPCETGSEASAFRLLQPANYGR